MRKMCPFPRCSRSFLTHEGLRRHKNIVHAGLSASNVNPRNKEKTDINSGTGTDGKTVKIEKKLESKVGLSPSEAPSSKSMSVSSDPNWDKIKLVKKKNRIEWVVPVTCPYPGCEISYQRVDSLRYHINVVHKGIRRQ
jgi:hypothetical protein